MKTFDEFIATSTRMNFKEAEQRLGVDTEYYTPSDLPLFFLVYDKQCYLEVRRDGYYCEVFDEFIFDESKLIVEQFLYDNYYVVENNYGRLI